MKKQHHVHKNRINRPFIQRFSRLLRDESGSVLVMFSVFLVVMLGFSALVIDIGALRLEKSRLVIAVDAAALAGARELPDDVVAEEVAVSYVEYNNVDLSEVTVTFDENKRSITVSATRDRDFIFGPFIGVENGRVHASATAQYGAVTGARGIVPFGIPEQELTYNQLYTLKAGSKDDYGPGNYGALALDLPGAKAYKENIKHGFDGLIKVGDEIQTETGNMSGPTTEGVEFRIAQCLHVPACTYDHFEPNCSKIMIVPIYDPTDLQGKSTVTIVGFAAFFVDGVGGSGNANDVKGYFLERMPPDGMDFDNDPSQEYFGLAAVRLIY